MQERIPLIVIVGPTGAGKSALAFEIAEKVGGEIVNADARQVYRGLDVVAAVPEDLAGTHLYAFKKVNEGYSFAQYREDADRVIRDIHARGKVPVVVGGTGLYVDALVYRFVPPPTVSSEIREKVAALGADTAREQLQSLDPRGFAAIDSRNPRRVQRALEVFLQTGRSISDFWEKGASPYAPFLIGWTQEPEELKRRIRARTEAGWPACVEEVRALVAAGHMRGEPGMEAIGVGEIMEFLRGEISETDAREHMIARTLQYAKRQMTWFRREPGIVWYTSSHDVWQSLHDFLQIDFKTF